MPEWTMHCDHENGVITIAPGGAKSPLRFDVKIRDERTITVTKQGALLESGQLDPIGVRPRNEQEVAIF